MKMIDKCRSAVRPLGLAVALCFSVAPAANATVLSNFLTFDGPAHLTPAANQGGGEDKLQDDSLTGFIDNNPLIPGIAAGDFVFGIITLSDLQASGRPNLSVGGSSQIAIMFAATIGGPGSGLFAPSINLLPNPALLAAICGPLCAPAGLTPTSISVVLSTTQSNVLDPNDPLNWDATPGPNNFTTQFNTPAHGWSWEATLGLTPGTDSFFEFRGGFGGGTERGAFDVTSTAFPTKGFHPTDVYDHAGGDALNLGLAPPPGSYHTNDVTLNTGTISTASVEEMARGWIFTDQGTFYVNPAALPEPTSVALLGLGLAGLGVASRRRNKKQ